MPRFYGQPKIHNSGVLRRPIVWGKGSPFYNLNKRIANFLKTNVKDENNNAKKSTTFSNNIRNVPIENDEVIVYNLTYVNNADQFIKKTTITQDRFLDLVNLVLTTTWYTFDSYFYQQIDDVAMGKPASSTTAEIFMHADEQTNIYDTTPSKVWEHFVDNICSIFKLTHLENVFHHINHLLSLLWRRGVMEN